MGVKVVAINLSEVWVGKVNDQHCPSLILPLVALEPGI